MYVFLLLLPPLAGRLQSLKGEPIDLATAKVSESLTGISPQ